TVSACAARKAVVSRDCGQVGGAGHDRNRRAACAAATVPTGTAVAAFPTISTAADFVGLVVPAAATCTSGACCSAVSTASARASIVGADGIVEHDDAGRVCQEDSKRA